jgi:hypothetical protein
MDQPTPKKRPISEKQRAANVAYARLSSSPRTAGGKLKVSQNARVHGMRSRQTLIEGEAPELYEERTRELFQAINPGNGLRRFLAQRAVDTWWLLDRACAAAARMSQQQIDDMPDSTTARDEEEARALMAKLDARPELVHRLLEMPSGVAMVYDAWLILADRLERNASFLETERHRAMALLGKRWSDILRDDPESLKWGRAILGAQLGNAASVAQVQLALGGVPPAGMPDWEFAIRAQQLAESLPTRQEGYDQLVGYVEDIIAELDELGRAVVARAQGRLESDKALAGVPLTPATVKLWQYTKDNDRTLNAILGRIDRLQNPPRRRGGGRPRPAAGTTEAAAEAMAPTQDGDAPASNEAAAQNPVLDELDQDGLPEDSTSGTLDAAAPDRNTEALATEPVVPEGAEPEPAPNGEKFANKPSLDAAPQPHPRPEGADVTDARTMPAAAEAGPSPNSEKLANKPNVAALAAARGGGAIPDWGRFIDELIRVGYLIDVPDRFGRRP